MKGERRFSAVVEIAGINPYVDVPDRVIDALGTGKQPVLVKVGASSSKASKPARDRERLAAIGRLAPGGWFRTTIMPSRGAPHRLYLDTWMRDVAGAEVGDRVRVRLKPDPGDRELGLPPELKRALDRNKKARAAWGALAPARRREILSYLNFLKTPAAVERNVRKTIDRLLDN